MGEYARNKTKVKFTDGNSSALKKSAKIRKKLIQLIFSRIHTKAVQVQKQIFSGNFQTIENQSGKKETVLNQR